MTESPEQRFHKLATRLASESERVAEKRFRRCGYDVERIPTAAGKRPDLLVSDAKGKILICEVKTLVSAGYLDEQDVHASLQDGRLTPEPGVVVLFQTEPIPKNVWKALDYAAEQYREFVADQPGLNGVPFAVALFMDFFVDCWELLPTRSDAPTGLKSEISGILKIEHAWEARKALDKCTCEQQQAWSEGKLDLHLGAITKKWRLRHNERATIPIPEHFANHCIVDDH